MFRRVLGVSHWLYSCMQNSLNSSAACCAVICMVVRGWRAHLMMGRSVRPLPWSAAVLKLAQWSARRRAALVLSQRSWCWKCGAVMWPVLFLFLSYLDGGFAKGELSEGQKDISFALTRAPCADTAACVAGLRPQKAEEGKSNGARQQAEDRQHAAGDTHTLRRSKRGFTYPGTLWCGAGNIADNYNQLGEDHYDQGALCFLLEFSSFIWSKLVS